MINDLLLRWVVTVLSALSGVECGLAIVIDRRAWTLALSNGLRLAMAIAMAVMVWPMGMRLAETGPAVFFVLAAVWFATVAVVTARTNAQRAVCGYHALTMIAMAWKLAVMGGHRLSRGSHSHHHHHMSADPVESRVPEWVTAIDWFWAVAFTLVAVFWAYRFAAERRRPMSHLWRGSLGSAGQAVMAAAMAVMFGAMLFRA
jgi:hypothetical protein